MSILVFVLIVLVVLALAIYALQNFLPGDANIKNLSCLVMVFIAILAIASKTGVF